jgi:transposase
MRLPTRVAATAVAATAAALGALFAGAGTAAADDGDRSPACNRGEICFSRDNPASRYQKHFWYAGNHAGSNWYDVSARKVTDWGVRNDASSLSNRDTICDVKVVNDRGVLPDFIQIVPNRPAVNVFVGLDRVNDANDRHERTNCL